MYCARHVPRIHVKFWQCFGEGQSFLNEITRPAAHLDRLLAPASHNRALRSQDVPLGFRRGSDIRMHKFGLLTAREAQIDGGMIGIGDIMPDPLMLHAAHTHNDIGDELQYPIQVVGTPVIEDAAGDGFVRMPVVAGVRIAADEGFYVEDIADSFLLEYLLNCQVIRVPAPTLVDRQGALVLLRETNHLIGLGSSKTEWLFRDHVLAGAQHLHGNGGMRIGWSGNNHHIDIRVFCHLLKVGAGLYTWEGPARDG